MLSRRLGCVLSTLLLSLFVASHTSALSIDVEQNDTSVNLASLSYPDSQSFKPLSSDLVGAGVWRSSPTTVADLTIALWDAPPSSSGAPIASATAIADTGSGWLDVFWAAVSVTPGQTYHLSFSGNNFSGGNSGNYILYGSAGDPYPDGNAATTIQFPTYDFAFRTWTSAVPEPTTTAMLIAAGLLLRATRRR